MRRLPRTRGDGPVIPGGSDVGTPASPHTRGWTRPWPGTTSRDAGFPAHAGMDPRQFARYLACMGLPRTRGDGPRGPRTGSTDPRASPHTRGWTHREAGDGRPRVGFPAHAGMDRREAREDGARARLPRTRGDGPTLIGTSAGQLAASPHTRGWTHGISGRRVAAGGFPAHAGMDPSHPRRQTPGRRLPRTRGDGPPGPWSRASRSSGFPAHAGMDPPVWSRPFRGSRLPRTRGDGPYYAANRAFTILASPHTRGWTRLLHPHLDDLKLG